MRGALDFSHYPLLVEPPPSWAVVDIAAIAQSVTPGFASGEHNSQGQGMPHLRPMNVDREGRLDLSVLKSVEGDVPRVLRAGDVLFNNTNSPELVGKTAVVLTEQRFAYSNHMTRIALEADVNPTFIAKQLHFLWMTGYFRHRCVNHVNQASISAEPLASTVPVLLPPACEQERIADTLDELFSDLDAAVAALERVRAKLKLYRASVLKAAVEGELTKDWRAQHPDAEPAAQLLQRILAERRRRWEEDQLVKYKGNGMTPPKNLSARYPAPHTASGGRSVGPDGWCWATLDELIASGPQNGLYLPSTLYGRGHPILRIDDFQNGWIRSKQEFDVVAADPDVVASYTLRSGDLIINRVNSMTHLGKCFVVGPDAAGALFESNMMRAELTTLVSGRFVEMYLHSLAGRAALTREAKWAVNQASINQQDVRRTPLPLPSEAEQEAIVEIVEDQLSVIDHLEADLDAKLKSAQALRQAILRRAFAGKLLPQDPKDEPAAELLKRIAAERAAGQAARSMGKRRTPAAKSRPGAPARRIRPSR